jgi:CRISPR-associated protein Cmr2
VSKSLVISLGPIQDFIQSARRCQDLWFGSWLLSDLSRTAAESVAAQGGSSVVFPSIEQQDHDHPGVANVIFARLPAHLDGRTVAEQARAAQQARLRHVADRIWTFGSLERYFHRDTALVQVDELMELVWVVVDDDEVAGAGDPYTASRAEAYRRLAAVKNTRGWSQPPWDGGPAPKSSLDGERESVIDESAYDRVPRDELRRVFGVKGKERLCGVGLLKRRGAEIGDDDGVWRADRPAFHSTAHVAASPALERLAARGSDVGAYLRQLQELGLDTDRFRVRASPSLAGHDGALLFPTRLEEAFEEVDLTPSARREAVLRAQQSLRTLLGGGEPSPYYGFLLADGDRMGLVIDGIRTLEGHRAFAQALNAFSARCAPIIHEHRGSLIFAGGDDILALVPLHTALQCARALADAFAEVVQPVATEHFAGPDCPRTTLSVGLAVTHSREPMSDARTLAKGAETRAKQTRNALAVVVSPRSGSERAVVGEWGSDRAPDRLIVGWARALRAGALSAKTAHDLEGLAAHYELLPQHEQAARGEEIGSLVREVLGRKRDRAGDSLDQDISARLLASWDPRDPVSSVRAMSETLQVARLFEQAMPRDQEQP